MAIQILFGTEPYGIDVKRHKLIDGVDSLNIRTFSGDFTSDILSVCQQYPFLADRKVVILDCASLKNLNNDAFAFYLEAPSDTTDLLIIVKDVDKRLKLYKKLQAMKLVTVCNKVSVDDFEKTILYEAKKRGGKITMGGLKAFSQRINYENVSDMNLVKAVSYLQTCIDLGEGDVTESVVEKMVPNFQEGNAFSVAPLIMSGDIAGYRKEVSLLPVENAIGTASAILRELRIAYKSKYFGLSELAVKKPSVFKDLSKEKLLSMIYIVTDRIAGVKAGLVAPDELLNDIGNALIKIVIA